MEDRVLISITLSTETYKKLTSICGSNINNTIGRLIDNEYEENMYHPLDTEWEDFKDSLYCDGEYIWEYDKGVDEIMRDRLESDD